jgi:thioredoxin-related protein
MNCQIALYHRASLILALICIATVATSSASSGGVEWYSYNEGMALSQSEKKKVFISFYADWCTYCRRMDATTFKDPVIVSYLKDNFIPIRVDVVREKEITAKYNINPLPDSWFISEDGDVIGNKPGFMTAEQLQPVLKFIFSESYLKMNYSQFLESYK